MFPMCNRSLELTCPAADVAHVVLIESYKGDGDLRFLGRCGSCSGVREHATRASSREEAELLRNWYLESFGRERLALVHRDDPCLDSAQFRRQLLEHALVPH